MTKLTPIELDDGTVIYVETTENVDAAIVSTQEPLEEEEREREDYGLSEDIQKQAIQNFKVVESTIRAYTVYTLKAFKQIALADINKVTLEFGIKLGGETGIPYVTKGTAESNLKITVECSFPNKAEK